jgi:hypothetical protein
MLKTTQTIIQHAYKCTNKPQKNQIKCVEASMLASNMKMNEIKLINQRLGCLHLLKI